MSDEKPYADACDRNGGPILKVLERYFADRRQVLSAPAPDSMRSASPAPWGS